MKKCLPAAAILVFLFFTISCRHHHEKPPAAEKPKLIVGIVVDQMRWDFLYRYSDKYSANGFKRLLREGYSCANTHINYSPSYTAPGHASVYTGSVPAIHGITGNAWYDYACDSAVYCTGDTMQTVGSTSDAGEMSPRRMMVTTITDELRLATNFQSKVIGIALKDRGSILPAGHTANAAYFYDGSVGKWITSSYYMDELPAWVNQFNGQNLPQKYLAQNWNTLRPLSEYSESHADDVPWEQPFKDEPNSAFEHKVSGLAQTDFNILRSTPYGNTYTLDFAQAAITAEQLGKGSATDFLAVSLSSTDYIGHQFGPNSIEMEDCYLRLDSDMEKFFAFLDAQVGKGNYLLFLTADHGAAHAPGFMDNKQIPAGVFAMDSIRKMLDATLTEKFGAGNWILDFENMQFSFNNALIAEKKVDKAAMKKIIKDLLLQYEGIANVLDLENLPAENLPSDMKQAISNGVYEKRSGDLYVLHDPGWFDRYSKAGKRGTTHGSVYPYDTHIPLVFMGWHVRPGEDFSEVHITDIAPTLAAMLHIQEPSGCVGKPIPALLKEQRRECPHHAH